MRPGERSLGGRDHALDYGKGILVLLIYCYHYLNFSTRSALGFQLLGWLPVSFICISGFLVSHVYEARFVRTPWACAKRLWVRGLKLLVLFTILNLLILLVRHGQGMGLHASLLNFGAHWWNIYLTGEGRFASFRILVPIAYFLLIGPAILAMDRLDRRVVPACFALIVISFTILDLQDRLSAHLILLSAGLPGFLYGRLHGENPLSEFNWHPLPSFIGYLALFAAGLWIGANYLVQLLWAMTGLMLDGAVAARLCTSTPPGSEALKWLRHLGQQSLFAYILQIGILQFLLRLTGPRDPFSSHSLLLCIVGMGAMIAAVELLHWAKESHPRFKLVYAMVFP